MKKLDITKLEKQKSNNIKIGELSQKAIDILSIDLKPQNIYVWASRVREHCEKHKSDYSSVTEYYKAIESIPDIISNPDYIGIHHNGNIQYVKKIGDISLVGVKVIKGQHNSLLFRTIYPISQAKLEHSIKSGKLYKF